MNLAQVWEKLNDDDKWISYLFTSAFMKEANRATVPFIDADTVIDYFCPTAQNSPAKNLAEKLQRLRDELGRDMGTPDK